MREGGREGGREGKERVGGYMKHYPMDFCTVLQ